MYVEIYIGINHYHIFNLTFLQGAQCSFHCFHFLFGKQLGSCGSVSSIWHVLTEE